jgi:hypothetical protein
MPADTSITINGTRLSDDEVRIVRLALEAFSDILENQLCIKDDGIPISDKYVTDTAHVLAQINGRTERKQ